MLNMVIKQMFSFFTIEVAFGWFQNSKHLSIVDTLIAFRNFLWSIFYSILKVVNRLFQLVWNDVIIKWMIQFKNLRNSNSERLKYFDRNSFQNDWCCIKIFSINCYHPYLYFCQKQIDRHYWDPLRCLVLWVFGLSEYSFILNYFLTHRQRFHSTETLLESQWHVLATFFLFYCARGCSWRHKIVTNGRSIDQTK